MKLPRVTAVRVSTALAALLGLCAAPPVSAEIDPRCYELLAPITSQPPSRSELTEFLCAQGVCPTLTCYTETRLCINDVCGDPFETPFIFELEPIPFEIIAPCDNPDHIFQCHFEEFSNDPDLLDPDGDDSSIWQALYGEEERANAQIRVEHLLPAADASRIVGWARNDLRARLFARLVEIAQTPAADRTIQEQKIAEAFEYAVRAKRIQAAELSIQEYQEWASNPCAYVPPDGFSYTPNPGVCNGTTLIVLFETVEPPPAEDFLAYGFALAEHRILAPGVLPIVNDTARIVQTLATLAGAEGAAAIAVAAVIAAAKAIFIHAAAELTFQAAALVAGGAAAGVAATVFLAVLVAIVQFISVFEATQVPARLDEALADAQSTAIALTELVGTDDGRSELYNVFLETTLPDFPDPGPPPGPSAADPVFQIADAGGSNPVLASQIEFRHWNGGDWWARLNGGWFVVGTQGEGGAPAELLNLAIEYEGWDGNHWTARRRGLEFVHNRREGDPENVPDDAYTSELIPYVDLDGVHRVASIYVDETPPEITPQITGTSGDNGWYVSDVDLSWQVSDPETVVSSTTGCGMETFSTDGTFSRTCEATSGGGTSSETAVIDRDATAPSIVGGLSGLPNANGWHRSDVVVSWNCSDATSGVAACSPSTTLGEGADQSVTGAAADHAGNEQMATVSDIDIDKAPPAVTLTAPGDGETFVLAQETLADWSATDALSGLAAPAVGTVDDGLPFDTSTTGMKSFVVTATDLADNTAEVTHTYTVLSPEEAAEALIEDIEELDLPDGTETSLVSKLEGAMEDLENGRTQAAEGKLRAFINSVEAQRGKKLTDEEADALIAMANLILGAF